MKTIKTLLVFLISLTVFAGVVPQAKLDLVNNYIAALMSSYGDNFTVEIASAHRNDETNQLDQILVKADFGDYGSASQELILAGSDVIFNTNFKITDHDGELINPESVSRYAEELLDYIEKFNAKGFYKATLDMSSDDKMTHFKVVILPASPEAVSIKEVIITILIPREIGKEAMIDIKGKFVAKADLVTIAQEGLTGIFTSLSNSEEPNEDDFEKVYKVVQSILKDIF